MIWLVFRKIKKKQEKMAVILLDCNDFFFWIPIRFFFWLEKHFGKLFFHGIILERLSSLMMIAKKIVFKYFHSSIYLDNSIQFLSSNNHYYQMPKANLQNMDRFFFSCCYSVSVNFLKKEKK